MRPGKDFEAFLEKVYGAERAAAILRQFDNAELSVGAETLIGELANARPDPAYHLVISEPRQNLRTERLGIGDHIIGRAFGCNITTGDSYMSRIHCLLTVHTDGHVTLRDLRSKNGTALSNEIISPEDRRTVHADDFFCAGNTVMLLLLV